MYGAPLRQAMFANTTWPPVPGRTTTSFTIESPYGIASYPNIGASRSFVHAPDVLEDECRNSPWLVAAYTRPIRSNSSLPIVLSSSVVPPTFTHVDPPFVEDGADEIQHLNFIELNFLFPEVKETRNRDRFIKVAEHAREFTPDKPEVQGVHHVSQAASYCARSDREHFRRVVLRGSGRSHSRA